jgi:hypothetical protein
MKKFKTLMVALGAVAMTGSALAIPTLIISDGTTSTSVTSANGIVQYSTANFDGAWSVVISSGTTKPADGSATNPFMDLSITATALTLSPARNLTISFFDTGYGPFNGSLAAILSGHVTTGTGQAVSYNTYWSALNAGATTTLLTASGSLSPAFYNSSQTGSISDANPFSITQVVTINGTATGPGGSYSLDASLSSVPDGGTTVMLLGAALSGLAFLRRKLA